MRAIQMKGYGGPEALKVVEIALPEPKADQVRVKVATAGVNPADWKWREGWFADFVPLTFPHTPGYDIAGVVDVVGADVTGFMPGDRVVGTTPADLHGGYAEYALASAVDLALLPESIDFASAAALPTPALTGVQLIEEVIQPRAGDTILITGAVGGVGRFAVHAARRRDARVVAAVRAGQSQEALRLGADEVIALGEGEWAGGPFDAVVDTVGGAQVAALCRKLRPGGRIATVATTPIDPDGLAAEPVFFAYHGDGARLRDIVEIVASGALTLPVGKRLPLSQAAEAQAMVQAGGQTGRIVLEP